MGQALEGVAVHIAKELCHMHPTGYEQRLLILPWLGETQKENIYVNGLADYCF